MNFAWSTQQEELFDHVEAVAMRMNENLVERDREGVFNHEGWRACAEAGVLGLPVPKQYSGHGHDSLTTVGALERLGYACRDNGLLFSINAHMWTAMMPLVTFGTDSQRDRWLPGLCCGQLIGGNAISEPDSGSDVNSLQTTAERTGNGYVLNGEKLFVTNGPIADVLVVFANIDLAQGARGITAFLIEKDAPGLVIGPPVEKMGLRTAPVSKLSLKNCEIPTTSMLGREGGGSNLFVYSMNWERGCILASAVGVMRRLLEQSIRFSKRRHRFGQSISKFQLVSSKIVDMKLRLETAQQILYHGAWMRDEGKTAALEAALIKLHISESWVHTCEDALQIHGGAGYMTETEIERELRDALGSRIYSGTSEIQRTLIASLLGL